MFIRTAIQTALLLALFCAGCTREIADQLIAPHPDAQRVEMLRLDRQRVAEEWGEHFREFTYSGPDGARLSACMLTPPAPSLARPLPTTAPAIQVAAQRIATWTQATLGLQKVAVAGDGPEVAMKSRGIVVLLHGLRDQKEGMLGDAEIFARHGYLVVCVDLRAHGKSCGRYTSFGYHERYDLVALLDEMRQGGYDVEHVGVFGRSLGAATALQWAAIDPRVRAVIAVAPFAELRTEEDYLIAQQRPPLSQWKVQWFEAAIEKEGHFHIDDVSPLRAVRTMRTPVYLVRGGKDDVVPASESDRLFDAARGPVIIERIATAGHHDVLRIAGPGFEERAMDWMDTFLGATSGEVSPPLWTIGIAHRNLPQAQRASLNGASLIGG